MELTLTLSLSVSEPEWQSRSLHWLVPGGWMTFFLTEWNLHATSHIKVRMSSRRRLKSSLSKRQDPLVRNASSCPSLSNDSDDNKFSPMDAKPCAYFTRQMSTSVFRDGICTESKEKSKLECQIHDSETSTSCENVRSSKHHVHSKWPCCWHRAMSERH